MKSVDLQFRDFGVGFGRDQPGRVEHGRRQLDWCPLSSWRLVLQIAFSYTIPPIRKRACPANTE